MPTLDIDAKLDFYPSDAHMMQACPLCHKAVLGWASATMYVGHPMLFCLPCGCAPFQTVGDWSLTPALHALMLLRMEGV
jgi:hypothetical protein